MNNSQFESQINVKWWPAQECGELIESDKDVLEDYGFDQVHRMVSEGFREGELMTSVASCEGGSVSYRGYWRYAEQTLCARSFALPFDITVSTTGDGAGQIASDLHKQFADPDGKECLKAQASSDALEAMILAMACEGIDLGTPEMKRALQTCVDAVGSALVED